MKSKNIYVYFLYLVILLFTGLLIYQKINCKNVQVKDSERKELDLLKLTYLEAIGKVEGSKVWNTFNCDSSEISIFTKYNKIEYYYFLVIDTLSCPKCLNYFYSMMQSSNIPIVVFTNIYLEVTKIYLHDFLTYNFNAGNKKLSKLNHHRFSISFISKSGIIFYYLEGKETEYSYSSIFFDRVDRFLRNK